MHVPKSPGFLAGLPLPSWLRRALAVALWLAAGLYFAVAILVLVVRHAVLPGIESYRGDIERTLSASLARPVAIRAIDARWQGLWPRLAIRGLEIRERDGRPALAFDQVEVDIAWASLWHLAPRFARLEIVAPTLDIRRDAEGRLFVAGLEIDTRSQDSRFAAWLLDQDRVVVRDATIRWRDELRGAPLLALSRLNFDLRSSGSRHRFGLTAEPPHELAARLDLRGDFRGSELSDLRAWQGEAYAELDYADLAGWHAWIDYPLELPRGSGGLRLWLGFADRALTGVTADVRLANLSLRLAPELPMLELARLDGRVAGRRLADGYAASAKRLALATADGIEIAPTDLSLQWHAPAAGRPGRGDIAATSLDLGALAALAGRLPLEASLRAELDGYGPSGRLDDLHLSWTGEPGQLTAYSLKAHFERLGLRARGRQPGFAGLSGHIEGSEKGGLVELASRDAAFDLPAVFAQPLLPLARLDARAQWRLDGGALEVALERASFENADATGEASGRYRHGGEGLGAIDLTAKLTRAAGGAVWRYIPLVVGSGTRDWLQHSIIGGTAAATLRLKGDLSRFPFKDGSGVFEIKGPFSGAALDYATGWPRFEDVAGELEFVGAHMTIRAKRAKLWGVALADVKAEIADLESREELMTIAGTARGPTADFLRYIEASPVGERIEHFTEDMTAKGNGELRLSLTMPLRSIADTKVDGRFRFAANTLVVDPDLPPLTEVNGELHFTGDRLEAQKLRAVAFGAPMVVDVATQDGKVAVKAAGSMDVRSLRQQLGLPVFDYLSGSAPWTGTVRVRKRDAEVRIESSLKGISSSLPEPFNKTAGDALPLVFERKPPPEPAKGRRPAEKTQIVRDQINVSLGETAKVQLIRHHDGDKVGVERGLVAIGAAAAKLPERGVLLAGQFKRLDADFWRRLANGNGNGAGLGLSQLDLRAEELAAFGRSFNGFRLAGSLDGDTWKLDLKSREATGSLEWNPQGAGRLTGRFAQLAFNEGFEAKAEKSAAETRGELPAVKLAIDRLLLKGRNLGEASLDGRNSEGAWQASFELKNEDGSLTGTGRWRPQSTDTQVDFKLEAKSIEKLLARAGYAEAVRRGTASVDGSLAWAGAPTDFDYASLNGRLELKAENGQFNKLEPGVGRLLGILSLQSLPRRITLDFRDIFSEGFAFDSIGGKFSVSRGVIDTRDLQIQGPAAKVLMTGSVNLAQETQNLRVRVQPALGETLATGVLLAHPATGAVVWLADKLLKDPLGQIFSYEYAVTGSWADPKVEKVGAPVQDAKPGAVVP